MTVKELKENLKKFEDNDEVEILIQIDIPIQINDNTIGKIHTTPSIDIEEIESYYGRDGNYVHLKGNFNEDTFMGIY